MIISTKLLSNHRYWFLFIFIIAHLASYVVNIKKDTHSSLSHEYKRNGQTINELDEEDSLKRMAKPFFSFDKVDLVVLLSIKANKWCHDIQSKKTYGMVQNLCSQSCTGRSRSQKQKHSLTFSLFPLLPPKALSHELLVSVFAM